jgi:glycosyltransferase involved in cell wall biosynthesis
MEIPLQRSLPITVIPCCVDIENFNPASIVDTDKAALREKLGIEPTTTVLSYVGSVGTWYLLPEMVHFFSRWLLKIPNSVFLFITPDNPSSIMIAADAKGIAADRVIIRSSSRADMPLHISISDYSLFFIRPSFSKQASSPTKLGEILAMGIPVICNRGVGDVAESVEGHSVGWVLDALQVEEYDRVIAKVDLTAFDATQIRAAALAQYSLKEGVRQYAGVYQRLIPS